MTTITDIPNITSDTPYEELCQYMEDHGIYISTMSVTGSLVSSKIEMNIKKIAKYIELDYDTILRVKYGSPDSKETNRSLIAINTKKKPKKKNFQHQVSLYMNGDYNDTGNGKYINTKIFKNGSFQMTGVKDIESFCFVINNLIRCFENGVIITKDGKKKKISFIDNPECLKLTKYKVDMIISKFKMSYQIKREVLFDIILENIGVVTPHGVVINCIYRPNKHPCVNIKYATRKLEDGKDINITSIFVFQTGTITITGAKNYYHIVKAHLFITELFKKIKKQIKVVKIRALEKRFIEYQHIKNGKKNLESNQNYNNVQEYKKKTKNEQEYKKKKRLVL